MGGRDFWKMSSITALLAAGEWSELSDASAQSTSQSGNGYSNGNHLSANMEGGKLGGFLMLF